MSSEYPPLQSPETSVLGGFSKGGALGRRPRRPRVSGHGPESVAPRQRCRFATACRFRLACIASTQMRIARQLWRLDLPDGYLAWHRLRQIWLVRQTTIDKDGVVNGIEDRYFITNLQPDRLAPAQILRLARRHWGIENVFFKSLDVQWKEEGPACPKGRIAPAKRFEWDKPWWTEGTAVPALGLLRLMACNILHGLRKRHLCHRVAGRSWPTPWRNAFDLIKAAVA
jgi:hypothetical protein